MVPLLLSKTHSTSLLKEHDESKTINFQALDLKWKHVLPRDSHSILIFLSLNERLPKSSICLKDYEDFFRNDDEYNYLWLLAGIRAIEKRV